MKKSEGIVQSDRTLSSKARVPLGLLYWPLGFLRLDGGWTGEERGQEIRKALSSPCRLQRTPCFGSCYRRTAVLSVSLKDSKSLGKGTWIHAVKTIFTTILRHYLPFSLCGNLHKSRVHDF